MPTFLFRGGHIHILASFVSTICAWFLNNTLTILEYKFHENRENFNYVK